ncbi:Mitochondrial cardiolipin hydrolase [Gryllus bimaculatus]|nr:Mitochondrial cardiolipin hydrolase [Gryllus bimaculatus]
MAQIGCNFFRVSAGLIAFDVIVYAIYYWHQKRERKKLNSEVRDCAIFHAGVYACGPYCPAEVNIRLRHHSLDCIELSLRKLTKCIEESKSSVDVALFNIACPELMIALGNEAKKGKVIHMITDAKYIEDRLNFTDIQEAMKKGVQIKRKTTRFLFHHKFIIIDKKVLFQGSCNFTNTALRGNCDNFLITSNKQIVKDYVQFYEDLWNDIP